MYEDDEEEYAFDEDFTCEQDYIDWLQEDIGGGESP